MDKISFPIPNIQVNNHNNCSPIKTISKEITKEKIEKIKTMIEITKEDFKKYIKSYMNEYLVNFEHDIQSAIIEALLKPYIQKMISFFHFCDCVLLNYNVEIGEHWERWFQRNAIMRQNVDNQIHFLQEDESELYCWLLIRAQGTRRYCLTQFVRRYSCSIEIAYRH